MAKQFDRSSMKDELLKRTQESDERKEGESLAKYFDPDLDLTFAKFGPTKEDPHLIDIVPFYAGKNMPDFMKVKEGKPAYYLDIYVHQNIGPGKKWIVCPQKNYGDPCPICEYIDELQKQGKEYEDFAEIAPKRRCVYNIINQTTEKERRKGVQIWEASHKYSEKPIQTAAKNPRGGGIVPFSHPDKGVGQSISFSVDNDTYRTISGHKLVPREEDISDAILREAHVLDEIIVLLPYKDIKKIFTRVEEEEDDVPDPERRQEEEEAGEKESSRDFGRSRREKLETNPCPAGAVFGEDIDKLADCNDCVKYKRCAAKADEIEDERRAKRQERTGRK